MKTNFTLKSSLMVLFLCLGLSSWGQETIFEETGGGTPIDWTFTNNVTTNAINQTSYWLVDAGTTSDVIITPTYDLSSYSSAQFSLRVASYGSGAHNMAKIEVSYDGGINYSDSFTSSVTESSSYNSADEFILSSVSSTVKIRISNNGTSGRGVRLQNLKLSGISPAAPIITVNFASLNMNTTVGTSVTSDIVVTGALLTSDISVAVAGDGFSVNPITLGNTGGTLTVTYNPATVGTHTGSITLSSTGAEDVIINLNGTATLAVPVATAATFTGATSFVANWNAVAGAESYEIDVYTLEDETSISQGSAGWNFNTESPTIIGNGFVVSNLIQGNNNGTTSMLTNNSSSSGYTGASGSNNAGAAARTGTLNTNTVGSAYFQFTLTSNIGGIVTLTGINFGTRSTSTGPQAYELRSSLDNYTNSIIDGVISNNSSWSLKTHTNLSISVPENQTITFRLYAYNGTGNAAANTANWRIDDLNLNMNILSGALEYNYILQNQNVGNVTSYSVTGLDPETTYYYVVRAVANNIPSGNSNEIEVTTTSAVVWTAADIWSNGTGPNAEGSDNVVIEGNLILTPSDDYSVNNLEVNGILIITDGAFIEVGGMIINNAGEEYFVIEKGGNLVQHNETPNIGAITVEVVSQTEWFGYNMFSSPVAGQTFTGFSGNINGEEGLEVYTYHYVGPADYEHYYQSVTGSFAQGLGYLFAAPYSPDNYPQGELSAFASEFSGVPNNGTVSVAVGQASYKAFGNPYPSAINTDLFFQQNNHVQALYFWTNAHFYQPSPISEYQGNNYAVRNYLAGTGTSADFPTPGATIKVGQGFLAWVSNANNVTFSNSMRETSSDGVFYRVMQPEKHILWLNLSNENNTLHQIAIGYASGATEGVDPQMDAEMFGYGGSALYSLIADQESAYVIQGRSLPFADTDVVPLGFRAAKTGSYTISLADFNGMFAEGQDIYIKDHLTETTHNLKEADYSFVSEIGVFEDRFEVVYLPSGDLNVTHPQYQNKWVVYSQDNGFRIETEGFELQEVKVYDVLGRLVYNQQAEGTHHSIQNIIDGVLIIKVTTTENQTLTKKIAK